jgi:hypothetical protein
MSRPQQLSESECMVTKLDVQTAEATDPRKRQRDRLAHFGPLPPARAASSSLLRHLLLRPANVHDFYLR